MVVSVGGLALAQEAGSGGSALWRSDSCWLKSLSGGSQGEETPYMAEDCLLGSWGWEAASHERNGDPPDPEGILSLGDWYPAAMKSVLESGGGVRPMLRIGRALGISLRGGTSAMAPPNESSPSLSASHRRVPPAHSADRRKTCGTDDGPSQ